MTKKYFAKFKTAERSPQAPEFAHAFFSALGALIAISCVALLSKTTNVPFMMAPFGATCVLAFGVQDSPLAQPRNIIGGHLIASVIGLACLHWLGNDWYSLALGVGLPIGIMQLTKTTHPPAGATPLVIILSGAKWSFILYPVLTGAVAIVVIALVFNNILSTRRYPKYWF